MRFLSVATLLALGSSIQAFVIPRDSANGLYSIITYDNGTEVRTKLEDRPNSFQSAGLPARSLERRDDGQLWCGCGFTLDPQDTDAAVEDMKYQLSKGQVPARLSFYSVRGSVVAFVCNLGGWDDLIPPDIFAIGLSRITNSCGRYIAGAEEASDNEFGEDTLIVTLGYQRWSGKDDFCPNARTSPANHC